MTHERVEPVLAHFERLDRGTAAVALATGLACPPGCGRCCTTPDVLVAEIELVPMAEEILRRGEERAWRERLVARGEDRRCPVYEPSPEDPMQGRCGLYAWRPLVCRLFGFSARRDKRGQAELAACKVHVELTPERVAGARAAIAAGLAVPMLGDEATALRGLDPSAAPELQPIGSTLLRLLEKLALARQLSGEAAAASDDHGDEPRRPPFTPRRAA